MVASLVTGCSLLAEEARAYSLSTLVITHPLSPRAVVALAVSAPLVPAWLQFPALESEQRGGKVAFTAGLPLLPLDSSEVVGAGTVLHSQHAATTAVQGVILCLVGLGSTKEK